MRISIKSKYLDKLKDDGISIKLVEDLATKLEYELFLAIKEEVKKNQNASVNDLEKLINSKKRIIKINKK